MPKGVPASTLRATSIRVELRTWRRLAVMRTTVGSTFDTVIQELLDAHDRTGEPLASGKSSNVRSAGPRRAQTTNIAVAGDTRLRLARLRNIPADTLDAVIWRLLTAHNTRSTRS